MTKITTMDLIESTSDKNGAEDAQNDFGNRSERASTVAGLIIGGFTLLGIGAGKLLDMGSAFTMLGIGAGMLIAAVVYFRHYKRS